MGTQLQNANISIESIISSISLNSSEDTAHVKGRGGFEARIDEQEKMIMIAFD